METPRMTLRPLTALDGPLLKDLNSDPEVMTYLTHGIPSTDEQVSAAVERVLATQAKHDGRFGTWLAHEKASGQFMGWFLFRPDKATPDNVDSIELGYRLKKAFWRQGFGSEGSAAFVELGFQVYKVSEIFAVAMKDNIGSQAVMKKVGLKFIEDFDYQEFPGPDKRAVRYALKRSEWGRT
jgi:RimJ/RimL family protein N-acetyltransferase